MPATRSRRIQELEPSPVSACAVCRERSVVVLRCEDAELEMAQTLGRDGLTAAQSGEMTGEEL